MPDVFSKKERSRVMSLIKSKNTAFELAFLKLLSAKLYPKGYRYRKHYKRIIGNPDIVFVKQKIAIFLDSDFWHGRNFAKLRLRLKGGYWLNKIIRNRERDKKVNRALKRMGWRVLRFGEIELKNNPSRAIRLIQDGLKCKIMT